jgi:hypothetical protein
MNPIFAHRHRPFLAAAMRLLGKSALYYALPPGQQPPDMLDALDQARPDASFAAPLASLACSLEWLEWLG